MANAQGEIYFRYVDKMPQGRKDQIKTGPKGFVISHSERGHHHLLERASEVFELKENVPAGMRILYAILDEQTRLYQDAATPHDAHELEGNKIVEFRIKREYDLFTEQARMVAD